MKKIIRNLVLNCLLIAGLSACGFTLQKEVILAPPLKRLYLQTQDPYGQLSRNLQQYLKMSHVVLVTQPSEAQTILAILRDETSQDLISVSGTQQTRQYNLTVHIAFQILDSKGRIIVPTQYLNESRVITVQSNQVLGSRNEAELFYQQMRRTLALAVLNRIASQAITETVNKAFQHLPARKVSQVPPLKPRVNSSDRIKH